jgi:hypothetical protein
MWIVYDVSTLARAADSRKAVKVTFGGSARDQETFAPERALHELLKLPLLKTGNP